MCRRALSQRGGLPALEHLNLSGCLFITEVGLQELVSACPSLNDEHFYYCDNINGNGSETLASILIIRFTLRLCFLEWAVMFKVGTHNHNFSLETFKMK